MNNQLLAMIYKDSEPQNDQNVCFKHFCDHKSVKPMVLLLLDNFGNNLPFAVNIGTFFDHLFNMRWTFVGDRWESSG